MPLSVSVPTVGQANSTEAVKVSNTLTALATWANGGIASTDINAALAQAAAVNQSGQTVKGATNIAASESRTNVAYGTLTTPDQVQNVVLPANGLIAIWYQATWQESVAKAGRAAIFIGSNQLKTAQYSGSGNPVTQAAALSNGSSTFAATNALLMSFGQGLGTLTPFAAYTGDITTGQTVGGGFGAPVDGFLVEIGGGLGSAQIGGAPLGGPCYVFAAAGTYTVSVQFKSSSGSVTASNRKLWVQALSFA